MSDQDSYEMDIILFELGYKARIGGKYLPAFDFSPRIVGSNSNKTFNSQTVFDNFRSDLHENSTQKAILENSPVTFRRTSVCRQFDPLYDVPIKVRSETYGCELKNSITLPECLKLNCTSDNQPIVLYETRTSLTSEETLISFASPKKTNKPLILRRCIQFENTLPYKLYSENEFRQILEKEGTRLIDEFLDKYKTLGIKFDEKDLALQKQGSQLISQYKTLKTISSEMHNILLNMSSNNDEMRSQLSFLKCDNEFLKDNIKYAGEKSRAVDYALSELHGRYDQCQNMINCYKENEKHLKNSINDLEDYLSKININSIPEEKYSGICEEQNEGEIVKDCVETEVQILNRLLQKAEMKISELENDFIQSKKVNSEICNMYESLVGKSNT